MDGCLKKQSDVQENSYLGGGHCASGSGQSNHTCNSNPDNSQVDPEHKHLNCQTSTTRFHIVLWGFCDVHESIVRTWDRCVLITAMEIISLCCTSSPGLLYSHGPPRPWCVGPSPPPSRHIQTFHPSNSPFAPCSYCFIPSTAWTSFIILFSHHFSAFTTKIVVFYILLRKWH